MDWAWFARQMASMARDLLAQESVDATLGRITHAATELVEGCDAAGILVLRGDAVRTLAATDDLVEVSDRIQGELREGCPASTPRAPERANGSTASPTSPRTRGAGPATLPGPRSSGSAA